MTSKALGRIKGHPIRFINGHQSRASRRAYGYVEKDMGYTTPCWLYQGKLNGKGYGMMYVSRDGRIVGGVAHRVSYERVRGPIPSGMELDHLCRVRHCINPDHLEPVTGVVNIRRGNAATLTIEDVRAIRRRGMSVPQLAARYGVSKRHIFKVLANKVWVE